MELSKILTNSIKYPFKNMVKLPIIFILFILIAIIPIGWILDNNYLVFIGVIAFFAFILFVPGYFLGIVRKGSIESSAMPSFNLKNNVIDAIRVLVLRIVYMIVPVAVFFISLSTFGVSSFDLLGELKIHSFLATIGLALVLILITYIIFEFLFFFAKARLAYLNSLSEALKIHKVIEDIKNIGIVNIIKWLLSMLILMIAASLLSSVITLIPYVGFLIYFGVIIPILESIGNYSLGLLYSNISRSNGKLNASKDIAFRYSD